MTAARRRLAGLASTLLAAACVQQPLDTIGAALACSDLTDFAVGKEREIRIAMLYTQPAFDFSVGLEAEIEQSIVEANVAFRDSDIPIRLVLAHMQLLDVTETSDETLLNNLIQGAATFADAHVARDRYHADVVGLVRSYDGGRGHIMAVPGMAHRDSAYFVLGRTLMGSAFGVPHELGHVLGGVHARGLDPAPRYRYAYPHLCPDCVVNGEEGWYTIMGTTGGAARIGNYSNPDVAYFGTATGVPPTGLWADNRRTLTHTSTIVAAFRFTPAWFVSLGAAAAWFESRTDDLPMKDIRIADFNGDGDTDAFRVDPATSVWYVSWSARTPWEKLFEDPKAVPMADLRFGDFDGDQLADVFYADAVNGQWLVSYKGTDPWQVINTTAAAANLPVTHLAFGHLDTDRKTDVFTSDGVTGKWSVAWAGHGAWDEIQSDASLAFVTALLRLVDLDGDGIDDVFRSDPVAKQWFWSRSGTSSWQPLNSAADDEKAVPVTELLFGDFNGDDKTDVLLAKSGAWGVSWGGTEKVELIKLSCSTVADLAIGDFDGDRAADVIRAGIRP